MFQCLILRDKSGLSALFFEDSETAAPPLAGDVEIIQKTAVPSYLAVAQISEILHDTLTELRATSTK